VPSLLDPDTDELFVDMPGQRSTLLAAAKLTEVERELRAQIDTVVDVGLAPTHLDWHGLADGGRADILELTMALAQEYGLAARVSLDCGRRKAAHCTEQWQSIEPSGWQVRQDDHAFLTSPEAREILDRDGITVIDYRPLQQAWNT
jgi:predicted glycoside hydrolase/deacetylase ChbG (UPF0249 family)